MTANAESSGRQDAVLAIQGGGVYGVTLIGQLQAVLDKGYRPMAFAGTSAGAIVATLAWAGFSPKNMRDVLIGLDGELRVSVLPELFGPFEPAHFDLNAFAALKDAAADLLKSFKSIGKSESTICDDFWTGLKARKFIKTIGPLILKRGCFRGGELERRVDQWIRTGTPALKSVVPEGEPVRFRHISDLMLKGLLYKPPLLLTATNLSRKKLEIISSIDSRYANVPIAKAVRASAGFPVFLTPQEISESPEGGWYVDGGLICNFPIWTLSDALRSAMQASHLEEIYRPIIHQPWVRIGLRIVDDSEAVPDLSQPDQFFESLWKMLSGGTRNELEDLLAANAARSIVVRQNYSTTDGPKSVLDVIAMTPQKIESMFQKGQDFASEELDKATKSAARSKDDELAKILKGKLEDLIKKCDLIFSQNEDCKFRANIFLPVDTGNRPRLRLFYSYNMEGDPDAEMEFPDLESGLTGFCYLHRHPQVCNLENIGRLRKEEPERFGEMFGMGPTLQTKVKLDRTWLASVPIFDPQELRIGRRNETGGAQKHQGAHYSIVGTDLEGPIFGVLNVDAGWDYGTIALDEDPNGFVFDTRVQTILAIMQTASFDIASTISANWPKTRG